MLKNETHKLSAFLILVLIFLTGCAGPATPFGALKFWTKPKIAFSDEAKTTDPNVFVEFKPGTQRFHHLNQFQVDITDLRGIKDSNQLLVFYNDQEVSDAFTIEREKNKIIGKFKNLRLNPRKLHKIRVAYQPHKEGAVVHHEWQMPSCDLTEAKPVLNTANFEVDPKLLMNIENAAKESEINPALLTALVAQESSFNNRAVSFAKALGMTQITHIAEEEIKNNLSSYPRYPGIRDLSYFDLRLKVAADIINEKNEWRLDPEKSFIGGSLYIKHILKYWGQPSKRTMIASNNLNLSHVALASYNIGPATVSRAIERKGSNWLQDSEVTAATKYVHMVGSYCSGFSEDLKNET
jgi:hypothetical protein